MSAFTVELDNHPGELARLCEAMASSGVNLLLCATTHGNSGAVAFIADDEAAAIAAERIRSGAADRTEDGAQALASLGIKLPRE